MLSLKDTPGATPLLGDAISTDHTYVSLERFGAHELPAKAYEGWSRCRV